MMLKVEIPEDLRKEIETLSLEQGIESDVLLNRILSEGLRQVKEKYVLELYKEKRITLSKASEMLGTDLWTMIEKLASHDIHLDYTTEELKEDLGDL